MEPVSLSNIYKPEVIYVLFPYVGETVGGSHVSSSLLVQGLSREKYEPVVLLHKHGALEEYLEQQEITYQTESTFPIYDISNGRFRAMLNMVTSIIRMVRFLKKNRISIVHVNDARMAVTWAIPARVAGCQFVVHQRTRHYYSRIPNTMFRLAHRVIAISNYILQTLPDELKRLACVTANPFEQVSRNTVAEAEVRDSLDIPNNAKVVTFIGTLSEQKRPLVFVEAAAEIAHQSTESLRFVMVGRDTADHAKYIRRKLVDLGISDLVTITGFRSDVSDILKLSDLVLAPAVNEGFGRVLVESALAGIPVVAADSGGHVEIIEDGKTGLLSPIDDPKALAQNAMRLLTDNHLTKELTKAALAKSLHQWSVGSHVQEIQAIYDRLLFNSGQSDADVVMVIEGLGGGGAQHVFTTIANHWVQEGRVVEAITFRDEDEDVFKLSSRVRRVIVPVTGISKNILTGVVVNVVRILKLRSALKLSGAPVFIGFIGSTNILLVLAAMGLGGKVIISERNDPARQSLGSMWDVLRERVYPIADLVTFNSRDALDGLSKFISSRKLQYLPNPLRQPASSEIVDLVSPCILSVGRLHRQKGYDILIEAFSKAVMKFPDWKLVIIGTGPEEKTLRSQTVNLGISDKVHWLGFVSDPFPYYRAADLFVMASRFEGMPNALLEAMSCGKCVMVSDALVGILDFVEDGVSGLVTPVENVSYLALAMEKAINNPVMCRKLGEEAKKRVSHLQPVHVLDYWDRLLEYEKI